MVSTGHLLAFSLTALAIIAVPGPSVLFVISRALTLGRAGALATVAGNAAGEYALVLLVAVGVGAIVERSVVVFTVLKLVGAAYVVYLGVQAVRHRRSLRGVVERVVPAQSMGRVLREGFVVGVANPKTAVFFAAVLPQFVDRSAGRVPLQLLVLGAVFIAIALVSDSMWALGAGAARSWFVTSPRRLELVGGTGGLIMIGVGASIALRGNPD
jgi:threonine/homoserine/homoserine lactone efflux protein